MKCCTYCIYTIGAYFLYVYMLPPDLSKSLDLSKSTHLHPLSSYPITLNTSPYINVTFLRFSGIGYVGVLVWFLVVFKTLSLSSLHPGLTLGVNALCYIVGLNCIYIFQI